MVEGVLVRRALVSVSDKSGLEPLVRQLVTCGVEIISTGGTLRWLQDKGIHAVAVSDLTRFPELMGGRVKTLHPIIHAGVLADRANIEHQQQLKQHGIQPIDLVVVNLYPFDKALANPARTTQELIENIDIGGPTLLRAAAKNHRYAAAVCDPNDYPAVARALQENRGVIPSAMSRDLAAKVFVYTQQYDRLISIWLQTLCRQNGQLTPAQTMDLPDRVSLDLFISDRLRYGENPHQKGGMYLPAGRPAPFRQWHGKQLSFNNLLDAASAFDLARGLEDPAAVIVKHGNPCGAASNSTLRRAFLDAWRCDTQSAFGGIVGVNRPLDGVTARTILRSGFLEVIVAPEFRRTALKILEGRKNLRLLSVDPKRFGSPLDGLDVKTTPLGYLVQELDPVAPVGASWQVVTRTRPTLSQKKSMEFAFRVASFVRSNAIVLARGEKTVGIGAGQMSRVDSVQIACQKAGRQARGSVMASDGFFPKPDSVRVAAKAGVAAIIQPGGSIKDPDVVAAANRYGIAMIVTGVRHFKH